MEQQATPSDKLKCKHCKYWARELSRIDEQGYVVAPCTNPDRLAPSDKREREVCNLFEEV